MSSPTHDTTEPTVTFDPTLPLAPSTPAAVANETDAAPSEDAAHAPAAFNPSLTHVVDSNRPSGRNTPSTPRGGVRSPSRAASSRSRNNTARSRPTTASAAAATAAAAAAATSTAASSSYRRNAAKLQSRDELRVAFNVFDTAQSGSISLGEFSAVYKMLVADASDGEIEEIITALDANQDGQITFDEFAALMQRRAAMQATRAGGAGGGGGGSGGGGGIGSTLLDDALSVFDSCDPSYLRMEISEIFHICDVLKEHLSEEEAKIMIQEMMGEDGLIAAAAAAAAGSTGGAGGGGSALAASGAFGTSGINYARLVQQMLPGGS